MMTNQGKANYPVRLMLFSEAIMALADGLDAAGLSQEIDGMPIEDLKEVLGRMDARSQGDPNAPRFYKDEKATPSPQLFQPVYDKVHENLGGQTLAEMVGEDLVEDLKTVLAKIEAQSRTNMERKEEGPTKKR